MKFGVKKDAHRAEYPYTTRDLERMTGVSPDTINLFFRKKEKNPGRRESDKRYTTTIFRRKPEKRPYGCRFSKEALDLLLEKTFPNRKNWPTAEYVAEKFELTKNCLISSCAKGRIRGRISLIQKRLHIDPRDIRLLILDRDYNLKSAKKKLGLGLRTWNTIPRWNKLAPKPFLTHGLGKRYVVPPWILGRLKKLKENGNGIMLREQLAHLYDSPADFGLYIEKILPYNPDNPPYIDECKIGLAFICDKARGVIMGKIYDAYIPTIKVLFPDYPQNSPCREMLFRVRNRINGLNRRVR